MKALNGKLEASETIRASDLVKLMNVVNAAVGLYNVIEREAEFYVVPAEWAALGEALRGMGLNEVTDDES